MITLGWRGATDDRIRERLIDTAVVFLTQDEDFLFSPSTGAIVVVSRVRQARRIADRVEIWRRALTQLAAVPTQARRFELLDDGTLLPWEQATDGVWISPRQPR